MGEPAQALAAEAYSFACPDWQERIRNGESLVPELPLNEAEADRAVAIFNKLRLPDVPGQPTMEEAAGDWFRDILRAAFGSYDSDTNERHVKEVFALVPKKNSKTTNGAALAIVAMLMNERPRAEMLLIGPTHEVADLAFQQASGMIEADEYLKARFQIREHLKTILDRRTKAKLKIKTFDMRVLVGSKPVVVIVDELHVMSSFSYAGRVIGQIRGGLLPNPESLLVFITTQSDEPPAGVFKGELAYARGIRDGRITRNVRTLPVLYEFPESMQIDESKPWADPKYWPMVLPNLGRSITLDRLEGEFTAASEKGEDELRRWASQHLNVEIGLALHADRWIGADYWLGAADDSVTLDGIIDQCEVAVVGIDGGGLDDLLGLTVIGRRRKSREWLSWSKAWAQSDVFKRKEIAERLNDFAMDGDLTKCVLPTQDIDEVTGIITKLNDARLLPTENAIGLDPLGVAAIVDALEAAKVGGDMLKAIPQGYQLSPAVWGVERKLKDGTFWHSNQKIMNWCVGNAKTEQRGNAVIISKAAVGKAKIDPLIALLNAAMLMSRNPAGKREPQLFIV